VQAFLNAPVEEPGAEGLALGEAIRAAHRSGENQAAIAARLGVTQQLVSAAIRERRLVGPPHTTLETPQSAANWLALNGFGTGEPLETPLHSSLLDLRATLLGLALGNASGGAVGERGTLNRFAERAPLRVRFSDGGEPELLPVAPGVEGFLAEVLGRVYEAMRNGTWERLKACPGDRCLHVFYDTSKNRTATWCSMAICGNRAKVRSYQQRRRAGAAP
jgi:predicted RNA-binding Zn ribbon-like protein